MLKAELISLFNPNCQCEGCSRKILSEDIQRKLSARLEGIYDQYFRQFLKNKSEALDKCTSASLPASFEEDKVLLRRKLTKLLTIDSILTLYYVYLEVLRNFMTKLHREVTAMPSRDAQLTCLVEAYCISELSADELTHITEGIGNSPPLLTCRHVTRAEFFEIVVRPIEQQLGYSCGQLYERLQQGPDQLLSVEEPEASDIDALILFIEGTPPQKATQARTSAAPDSLDCEISAFTQKLQSFECKERVKPKLSEEWLAHLRAQVSKKA